jgi:hypothetical protein
MSAERWNTSETSRRGPLTPRPAIVTLPLDAGISPARMRSSVDLPQPERPTSVTNSFSPISRSICRSASTAPPRPAKVFEMPSIEISGGASPSTRRP